MVEVDPDTMENILSMPFVLDLSVNDLRILVDALDALNYFCCTDGEAYLDADGHKLRDRVKKEYESAVNEILLRSRFTLIRKQKEQA